MSTNKHNNPTPFTEPGGLCVGQDTVEVGCNTLLEYYVARLKDFTTGQEEIYQKGFPEKQPVLLLWPYSWVYKLV